MNAVIQSALAAIADLKNPSILKLLLLCMLLTLLVLTGVGVLGFWVFHRLMADFFPVRDAGEMSWLWDIAQGGAYILFFSGFAFAMILTFWSLVILIANFFDEAVAQRVEEARYPAMAIGTPQPFWPELQHDLGFMIKLVFYNLGLILLSIIIFPLLAVLPLTLSGLSGYLIGQEFFTMAGGRHIGRPAAYQLAKRNRLVIFLAGFAMLLASSIPLLNLAVPFWGVAMMVHLYHRLSGTYPAQEILPPTQA